MSELIFPVTGQIVSRDNPEECLRVLMEIRTLEDRLRELKRDLKEAVVGYSRDVGNKTISFNEITASVIIPSATSWDIEVLEELIAAGLPEDRYQDLVQPEISYKVNGSVARSIAASNEKYGEIIDRAKTVIYREPNVTIKENKRKEK